FHAQREQLVEIDVAYRLVRADVALLLQHDRSFVQPLGGAEDGKSGAGVAADDRPVDGRGAAILRQQRRVVLNRTEAGNLYQAVGRKLQHVRHDTDVGLQAGNGAGLLFLAQRLELNDLELFSLGGRAQRVGLGAGLLGRTEHARHVVAAGEKRIEYGFAEVLLPNDRYLHFDDPD